MTDAQKRSYIVLRKRLQIVLSVASVLFLLFFFIFYIRYGAGLRNLYKEPVNGLVEEEDIPIGLLSSFLFNFFCFLVFFSSTVHFKRKLKNEKINILLDIAVFLILLSALQLTIVFDFMEAFDTEMRLLPVMFVLSAIVFLTNLY